MGEVGIGGRKRNGKSLEKKWKEDEWQITRKKGRKKKEGKIGTKTERRQ